MTILFDLDGTLIDSTDAIVESFEVSYTTFNEKIPPKNEIIELIGYPLDTMFEKLGINRNVWEYVDAYKNHYRKISRTQTTLLPFAKEALEKASQNHTLGVVTTKTAHYSKELLEHMDIMRYFDVLIGRESVINPKPHPEPILKAIEMLDAKLEQTWMIGDTILDLQAADSANVKSVGVLCGYGKEEELKNFTKHIVANSLEAVEIILKS